MTKRQAKSVNAEQLSEISVQLARQLCMRGADVFRISKDAMAIERLGRRIRGEAERGRRSNSAFSKLSDILSRYDAEAVYHGDLNGTVVGARFREGNYSGPLGNLFTIA
jgi:gamma-glutamylcysteine synthetase